MWMFGRHRIHRQQHTNEQWSQSKKKNTSNRNRREHIYIQYTRITSTSEIYRRHWASERQKTPVAHSMHSYENTKKDSFTDTVARLLNCCVSLLLLYRTVTLSLSFWPIRISLDCDLFALQFRTVLTFPFARLTYIILYRISNTRRNKNMFTAWCEANERNMSFFSCLLFVKVNKSRDSHRCVGVYAPCGYVCTCLYI